VGSIKPASPDKHHDWDVVESDHGLGTISTFEEWPSDGSLKRIHIQGVITGG